MAIFSGSLLGQECFDFFRSRHTIQRRRHDLDTVASGQNDALLDRRVGPQPPQRLMDVSSLEGDAFSHFDRRAPMIHTNDDNFFVHLLFEPASMPAGKNRISQQKIADDHRKSYHREERCLFPPEAGRNPAM